MEVEDKINDCQYASNQIKYFNPDPYYVNQFFLEYIQSVNLVFEEILQEANRDLGLFVSKRCTPENFDQKAVEKNDKVALEFLTWFRENYKKEHSNPYPNFIKKITEFFTINKGTPKIIVKILSNQRYENDPIQEIVVNLKNGKLKSKEDLQIQVKRQVPIFLEIINHKRKSNQEPKVLENQIIASTFLQVDGIENIEIPQACEIYLQVMKRFLKDSREKINQLVKRL